MFAITCQRKKSVRAQRLRSLSTKRTNDSRSNTWRSYDERTGEAYLRRHAMGTILVIPVHSTDTVQLLDAQNLPDDNDRQCSCASLNLHYIAHYPCKHVQKQGCRPSPSHHSRPTYRAQIVGDLIERLLRLLMNDLQNCIHHENCCPNNPRKPQKQPRGKCHAQRNLEPPGSWQTHRPKLEQGPPTRSAHKTAY